jgi:hypothetical protein
MMFTSTLLHLKKLVKSSPIALVGSAIALSVASCTVPSNTPNAQPSNEDTTEHSMFPEMAPEAVVESVLEMAAQDLSASPSELSILRVNQETWTDSCLGLGLPNESCLRTQVDGWQLEVVHDDESVFYRSDADGDAVRQSYLENNLPPSIRDRVLQVASADSGVPAGALEVAAAEPRLWDGCLGIQGPDTMCTQVAIYGWRAVVPGENRLWVYHTDMIGDEIRLNDNDMGR